MMLMTAEGLYDATVLGGQKISGADIRDQNGTSDAHTLSFTQSLIDCSPRNPGDCKCS